MKKIILGLVFVLISLTSYADCGIFKSYIILDVNNTGAQYYAGADYPGDSNPEFQGQNFGSPTSLILKGAEVNTYKNSGSNVTGAYLNYEVYKVGEELNSYTGLSLPFNANLGGGDQRWAETNSTTDLLALMPTSGTWNIEIYWSATSSDGDKYENNGGNNFIASLSVTILPVELAQFAARATDQFVNIDWTTASESNSDYFRVERSIDGDKFEEIGRIKAQGNSVENIYYSFLDQGPAQGINYYRLGQVDLDASFNYSEIVQVNIERDDDQVHIYPIPTDGDLNVSSKLPVNLLIYSTSGALIHSQRCSSGLTEVDLTMLESGLYFYEVFQANNKIERGKIIIE